MPTSGQFLVLGLKQVG